MEAFVTFIPDEAPYGLTLKEISDNIISIYNNKAIIVVCREIATNEHYHMYIRVDGIPWSDKTRMDLKRRLREFLAGEIRISKRKVEDRIKAIAYTIKDGNYYCHGIDWFEFTKAKEISHPKDKSYNVLIKDFYSNVEGKTEMTLIDEVIDIFDKCNIPICTDRIAKIVRLSIIKKKDASFRNRLKDMIFDKL